MAKANRRARTSVGEMLRQEAHRFEFVQAVRVAEFLARSVATGPCHVGGDLKLSKEAVRFKTAPSLTFAASEVLSFGRVGRPSSPPARTSAGNVAVAEPASGSLEPLGETRDVNAAAEMLVSFLGLTGPAGVLPLHYTSLLIERCEAGDSTLRDFLDKFHHRSISFFYRASEKYFLPLCYERHRLDGRKLDDSFTACLRAMIGMGTGGLANHLSVDDETLVYYSGHYAHFPRSAVSLEFLLADYFHLPVRVEQFSGEWIRLPSENRSCLAANGKNRRLGHDLVIGSRVWTVQSRFRIKIGPLTFAEFRRFLPDGESLERLVDLVRMYTPPHLDFDAQLILKAAEVPRAKLSLRRSEAQRLGWDTWSLIKTPERDADQAVFTLRHFLKAAKKFEDRSS